MNLLGIKTHILVLIFSFLSLHPLDVSANEPAISKNDKHGGMFVGSIQSDPKSFNAITAKETSTTFVTNYIFEGLTVDDGHTAQSKPQLAKTWKTSEDGLTWTFYLRDDVLWNDGQKFSADDVVFTYNELIYNPDIPNSSADSFTINGEKFQVKKIDDYTVEFQLPVKFAPFIRFMSQEIMPKHKLQSSVKSGTFNNFWGIDTDPNEIVGTGAYKLVKYDQGQRLVFERNPLYWKKTKEGDQLPYIEKLVYLIVQNGDVALLKFLEGTTDYISLRGMDYSLVKPNEKKFNFTIYDLGPDRGSQFVFFNQNPSINPDTKKPYLEPHKLKWFTDIGFKRAVAHSIDKDKLIEIVNNRLGYPQHAAIGPGGGFFHNPNVKKYEYDLDQARAILTSAGYIDRDQDGFVEDEDGNKVEFSFYTNSNATTRLEIAGIIRQDLKEIGMDVNFVALEFNSLVEKINASFDWDMILLGLTGGIEPHGGMNVWHSTGTLHMWNPRQETPTTEWEARIDDIFELGVQELDENKRKVLYDEYQMIISEQLPLIYTVLSSRITAVRNKFGNLDPANYGGIFHNFEEIYIKKEFR